MDNSCTLSLIEIKPEVNDDNTKWKDDKELYDLHKNNKGQLRTGRDTTYLYPTEGNISIKIEPFLGQESASVVINEQPCIAGVNEYDKTRPINVYSPEDLNISNYQQRRVDILVNKPGKQSHKTSDRRMLPLALVATDTIGVVNIHNKTVDSGTKDPEVNLQSIQSKAKKTRDHILKAEDAPYKCTLCPKVYYNKSAFDGHLNIHNNCRPWICKHSKCNASFTHKAYLTEHMSLHSSIRHHICNICHAGFRQSSTLLRHKLTHSSAKSLMCQKCGKSFHRNFSLKQHLEMHERNDYGVKKKHGPCVECGKYFTKKSTLKEHMNTHRDHMPYKCLECGRSFKQRGTLCGHMRGVHARPSSQFNNQSRTGNIN